MISKKHTKKYCCEELSKIKNYSDAINDKTEIWHIHHLKEDRFSREELIEMGLYYNRPASELIFLTPSNHKALHNKILCKGLKFSEERNAKISLKTKGEKNHFYGKHHSDETKVKISNAMKHPRPKYKWLTPSGEIKIMPKSNVHRYHPDWKVIGEI